MNQTSPPSENSASTSLPTALKRTYVHGIVLKIEGIGPVPSFKNGKQISLNKKTGKRFLRTDSKKKEWMEKAIDLLECQLRGYFPIIEGETHGEWQKRLQTVLLCLQDDCVQRMLPGEQNVEKVEKGKEGAIIKIEQL